MRISLCLFFLTLCALATSQENMDQKLYIDLYHGFPHFGKTLANDIVRENNIDSMDVGGYGPAGLRLEYRMADRLGIGFDAIFSGFSLSGFQRDSSFNDVTQVYDYTNLPVTFSMNRIRIQARITYHLEISNPKLDVFFGFAAGSNLMLDKYEVNGVEKNAKGLSDLGNMFTMPVSMRTCIGLRYYFSESIGMNFEMGLGGPLLSTGLAVRF